MSKHKLVTLRPFKASKENVVAGNIAQLFEGTNDTHFALTKDGNICEAFLLDDWESIGWRTGDEIIQADEAAQVLEERPVLRQWRASMNSNEAMDKLWLQGRVIDEKISALQKQRSVIFTKMESMKCPDKPKHLKCTEFGYDIRHDVDRIRIGCMGFSELTARKLTAIMVAQAKNSSRRKR